MGIEGVLDKGFVTTSADKLINWARTGSLLANDLRLGLLCGRDDARRCCPLRYGPIGLDLSALSAAIRRDDCGWNTGQ